jgi:hypothetical protein
MDRRIVCLVALTVLGPAADPIDALAETRGIVELFTSQGCSSCPPADRLLGQLATAPSIVAMSLPIDYWDYLGWHDTLASPGNSARQRAYARTRGDREIYTPQLVINGTVHVPGGDEAAVDAAMAEAQAQSKAPSLPVTISTGSGHLNVTVAAGTTQGSGEVWLCELSRSVVVKINRGENGGRAVTYHNVVRRRIKLGDWHGEIGRYNLPLTSMNDQDVDTVAVIVQAGNANSPGAMLGGAIQSLRTPQANITP